MACQRYLFQPVWNDQLLLFLWLVSLSRSGILLNSKLGKNYCKHQFNFHLCLLVPAVGKAVSCHWFLCVQCFQDTKHP